MEIRIENGGTATIVRIAGSVDGTTADALMEHFQAQIAGGATRLVGELSAVEYTSSAGLRTLLATVKEARRQGGDFRLAAARPEVLRVLELSGFTTILRVFADLDAAVASFD
jgi:anti-sigma B factor antagonist